MFLSYVERQQTSTLGGLGLELASSLGCKALLVMVGGLGVRGLVSQ